MLNHEPGKDSRGRKSHILLVDDDASLIRLLTIRLENEGYQISTASSAHEALQKLRSQTADLLLTDLRMDEMDGMGLFGKSRNSIPACRSSS